MGCACCKTPPEPTNEIDEIKEDLHVPILWLLGSPGSGLEAQIRRLKYKYKLHNLSLSQVLKSEMESKSPRGIELAHLILKDLLPPENVILDLFRHEIYSFMYTTNGFYMEQFPLTVEQGVLFEQLVAPVSLILYFECPTNILIRRLSRGKSLTENDELSIAINKKINKFHTRTSEVIQHYSDQIIIIDSSGDPDQVFLKVEKIVDKLYTNPIYVPALPFNTKEYGGEI